MSELIDNRKRKIESLKEIIRHLHAGQNPAQVKEQLRQIVRSADAGEIMAMEQELIAEGMSIDEVRSMCDLHSQMTREVLVQIGPLPGILPGHPVDTFKRENEALKKTIAQVQELLAAAASADAGEQAAQLYLRLRQAYNDLADIDKHYQRKEHALFSCLERHGISGPSQVMWAKDDEARALLDELGKAISAANPRQRIDGDSAEAAAKATAAIEEMIYKEENILLPMSLKTLTEEEWGEIWLASPAYGWCMVEPLTGYQPPASKTPQLVDLPQTGAIQLPAGHVSVQQLAAIFSTLPIDPTFVDAEDRVAFFTEGPERIFVRSKAVLGRKVLHCHPPGSVDIVKEILSDFRSGRKDLAEFWINFHGKMAHIRYFAVRDADGAYLGTIEMTQDIAPLRKLEGKKRLLEYE